MSLQTDVDRIDGPSLGLPYLLTLVATTYPTTRFLNTLKKKAFVWATGECKSAKDSGCVVHVSQAGFDAKLHGFLRSCASHGDVGVFVAPKANWDSFIKTHGEPDHVVDVDVRRFGSVLGKLWPMFYVDRKRPLILTVGAHSNDLRALVDLFFETDARDPLEIRVLRRATEYYRGALVRTTFSAALLGGVFALLLLLPHVETRHVWWIIAGTMILRAALALSAPPAERDAPHVDGLDNELYLRVQRVAMRIWYSLAGVSVVVDPIMLGSYSNIRLRLITFGTTAALLIAPLLPNWSLRLSAGAVGMLGAFLLARTLRTCLRARGFVPTSWITTYIGMPWVLLYVATIAVLPVSGLMVIAGAVLLHDWHSPLFLDRMKWEHRLIDRVQSVYFTGIAVGCILTPVLVGTILLGMRRLPISYFIQQDISFGVYVWTATSSLIVAVVVTTQTLFVQTRRAESILGYIELLRRRQAVK